MGMWNRLTTLMRANLNSVVKSSEDPEKILGQLILDMQDQMTKAKREVATVIAQERQLRNQFIKEQRGASEWEKKAMMAIRANRDDLAKEALRRKAEHDTLAEGFQAQWEAQKAATAELKGSLRALNSKIDEAQRRRQSLVARKRHVEAQRTMQATMSSISKNNPAARFDEFERRIDEEEVRLQASIEVDEVTAASDLDARFAAITRESADDDALAALKSKMRSSARGVHVSFEEEGEKAKAQHEVHVSA